METLLRIREKIRELYARFDLVADTAVKFVIAYAALRVMSRSIGWFETLKNPFIMLIIALICCIIPYGMMAAVLAVWLLLNVYKVSLEATLILAVFIIVVALLYYGFHPDDSHLLILTPLLFALRLPYLLPVLVGLGGSIISIIPVSCGIVLYYMLSYLSANAEMLRGSASMELTERIRMLITGFFGDKTMWLLVAVFAATILVVFVIRHMSFDYSRYAAAGVGAVVMIVGLVIGQKLLETELPIGRTAVVVILSVLLAVVWNFFTFLLDYSRTERTQFEDDDYYYYVKAVPKLKAEDTRK